MVPTANVVLHKLNCEFSYQEIQWSLFYGFFPLRKTVRNLISNFFQTSLSNVGLVLSVLQESGTHFKKNSFNALNLGFLLWNICFLYCFSL